jgi:PleD family two-component response regulator
MKSLRTIHHILLVDDDRDDCELFEEALHDFASHIKFSCLTNPLTLLSTVEELQPDLIFLDVNMPKKNGFECLDEIKRSEKLARIPIIMYSNTGRPEDVDAAYRKGVALFLKKPPTYTGLIGSLKEVIEKEWNKFGSVCQPHFL